MTTRLNPNFFEYFPLVSSWRSRNGSRTTDEDMSIVSERLTIDVTKETISNKITELNTNKSPGPDNMHPRIVKELSLIIVNPFYYIFNLSIKTGKIPSRLEN